MNDTVESKFNPKDAFCEIKRQWTEWAERNNAKKWILGISGGKDSLVVAALASRIFGYENVYGVMMPNGIQSDQGDAERAIKETGINPLEVNIGKAYEELIDGIAFCGIQGNRGNVHEDTRINLPPRIRMAVLFGIAQTIGAMVLNTDNLSERICGYSTLGGDDMGSYAPIQNLTVTEVLELGDWLGLPYDLVHKKPGDGLQKCGDEERLGLKYADLDVLIRTGIGSLELIATAINWYRRNRFKSKMIVLEGPEFGYPNAFSDGRIN